MTRTPDGTIQVWQMTDAGSACFRSPGDRVFASSKTSCTGRGSQGPRSCLSWHLSGEEGWFQGQPDLGDMPTSSNPKVQPELALFVPKTGKNNF
jgi:hypothetical protein